jgi:beta-barrel assembly-enhancing protease
MSDSDNGRRSFLRSACRHCLGFSALLPAANVLAQPAVASLALPPRFTRPAIDTDEGGLWGLMDREETRLRRSSFVIRDADLSKYLNDVVCRLAGDHCPDIRIHVVRTPLFNATMAPNGMMQIWSGLLLRVENEAQLAAVLGHELSHYLERHSLERLRDLKSRAAFATFIGMFGLVGALAQLGILASAFAFTRDQETRADRLGMGMLKRAGYDGQQAAFVWDNLLNELKITGGEEAGKRSPMMATHPPVETRRDDLLKLAGEGTGETRSKEFEQVISLHRFGWLHDEIRRGQYEESLVLLERMLARAPEDGQLLYARGEVFRLRAKADDVPVAVDSLTRAAATAQPPVETFRSLGLVHKARADAPGAVSAFEKYLAIAPDAADAGLIKTYLLELKP